MRALLLLAMCVSCMSFSASARSTGDEASDRLHAERARPAGWDALDTREAATLKPSASHCDS